MKAPRFPLGAALAALVMACSPAQAEEEPVPFPAEAAGTIMAADSRPPKLLQRVAPAWPAEAKAPSVEVAVYVAFVVAPDGSVRNPRALFGRFPEFEAAAVAAVAQWRFTPGKHEGHAVATQMIGTVIFAPPPKQS